MTYNKHLTAEERTFIESSLNSHSPISSIASSLGRDISTVSKEIKRNLIIVRKGAFGRSANSCIHRFDCKHRGVCSICSRQKNICSVCGICNLDQHCPDYQEDVCPLLLKPPYVCNVCSENHRCTLNRHLYSAYEAQISYRHTLSESRKGHTISPQELKQIDNIITPLLKGKGQSISHICKNNRDLIPISERTLYTLVDENVLGAINLDMPAKVRYRNRKNKKQVKVDRNCRKGRTYTDFLEYIHNNPDLNVVQIDTVEGTKGTAVLLTMLWENSSFQIAFKRDLNNARSVTEIFDRLYEKLSHDTFCTLFPLILTDNGYEFSNPVAIENHIYTDDNGEQVMIPRTKVFYYDPSAPYQKGACERNHEFIRKFIPKGQQIKISQEEINLMMSHINNYKRKGLNMKSPLFIFSQLYGFEIAQLLGSDDIDPNDVCLNSDIFKNK